MKTKITLSEALEAVKNCRGIKKTVCARLRISRPTFDSYLRRWKKLRDAFGAEEEDFLDHAEVVVADAVTQKKCLKTAKWLLATKGARRGYVRPTPVPLTRLENETKVEVMWIDDSQVGEIPVDASMPIDEFLKDIGTGQLKPEDVGLKSGDPISLGNVNKKE